MTKQNAFIRYLPIYGCIATGLIYVTIGVIAMLSFLKYRDGGADEGSMLAIFNDFTIGKVLVWIVLSGSLSYIAWRLYEAFKDPYGYGSDIRSKTLRFGIALSTIADILIVYNALRVLVGTNNIQLNGEPLEERESVRSLLTESWGQACVVGIGSIILITAVVQLVYGLKKGYEERIDMDHFSRLMKTIVHFLAGYGYIARGVILGIMGYFFLKAGITEREQYIVNTDKAFDFIGDNIGHVYFVLVAVGTICYGIFMFVLGFRYDADKD